MPFSFSFEMIKYLCHPTAAVPENILEFYRLSIRNADCFRTLQEQWLLSCS
jgi:hypothetical protein